MQTAFATVPAVDLIVQLRQLMSAGAFLLGTTSDISNQ